MGVCGIKKGSSKQDNLMLDDTATLTTSTQKSTARVSLVCQIPFTFAYSILKQHSGEIKLAEHKITKQRRLVTTYEKPQTAKEERILNDRFTQLISLAHPNIQKFYDVFAQENQYLLIQECIDGIQLEDYLTKFKQSVSKMRNILRHILQTLQGLHSKSIYHGSLCPDNILYNSLKKNAQLKLVFTSTLSSTAVHYKSPEAIKGQTLTLKSDIWSFGVLTYYLLSGMMPFRHRDPSRIPNCIIKGVFEMSGHEWGNVPQDVKILIESMLQYKEKDRPSAQQILNHQWFKKKSNEKLNRRQTKMFQKNAQIMDNLNCQNKIQQAAMMHIIENGSNQRDIFRLLHIFKKLDTDNSGTLSKEELLNGYSQLMSREEAEKQVDKIFQQFDCDGSGEVDYNEFLLANCLKEKMISKEKLTKVFQFFDQDGQGQLTFKEVSRLLVRMKLNKNEIRQAMQQFDSNNDGFIDLDEFISGMMNIKEKPKI